MRKSADWMTVWDDRILEIIDNDPDDVGKVGNLVDHPYIHIAQSSVSRRCQKLAEHGLLRPIGDGVYLITERGEAYLRGEYNAETEAFMEDTENDITISDMNDTPSES
ncbi:MAG: repressor of nif and glnA expression [Haloarculaceae archaeon]|jgi:repressor of nif and glnA expression